MVLHILRALFVLLMAAVGWSFIKDPATFGPNSWMAMAIGLSVAVFLLSLDILSTRRKLTLFSGVLFGLVVGICIAYALSFVTPLVVDYYQSFSDTPLKPQAYTALIRYINLFIGVTTSYIAISFILQTKDDFRFIIPFVEFSKQTKGARPFVLDSSVLIDGRIEDIARTGIIESQLIVPRFIQTEMQRLADNSDKLIRARGRRGLDVLTALKSANKPDIVDYDSSGREELNLDVDQKLIALAKELNGRVLTNDYNMNKVAQLRGVDVVNLNELANAMKPEVMPGEKMTVRLIKPGESTGQGVGYLDDGTMVVVEGGRPHINEDVEFTVTNTRQTVQGRMIFGRLGSNGADGAQRKTSAPGGASHIDVPVTMTNFAVILPAGGSSNRFGKNKLTELLRGKPVIAHSLRAFTRREDVSHVIVPTNNFAELSESLTQHASTLLVDSRLEFCVGGTTRAESVLRGLQQLPPTTEWVAIHDAARPLVTQAGIDETLAAAVEHGAAVAAFPAHLTIKQATGPLPARVDRTLPRAELWAMQTPQIMRRVDLLDAFARCPIPLDQVTDDAQLLELAGKEVWLVPGDERNIKITTPLDLKIAELLM